MKIKYLESNPAQSRTFKPEAKEVASADILMTLDDRQALDRLKERHEAQHRYIAFATGHRRALMAAIEGRNNIKELIISEGELSPTRLQLDSRTFKELEKEAEHLGISIHDYVRGIIYSTDLEQSKEESVAYRYKEQQVHENRKVVCELILNREIRDKLYQKFGRMDDRTLKHVAASEALSLLSKIK